MKRGGSSEDSRIARPKTFIWNAAIRCSRQWENLDAIFWALSLISIRQFIRNILLSRPAATMLSRIQRDIFELRDPARKVPLIGQIGRFRCTPATVRCAK